MTNPKQKKNIERGKQTRSLKNQASPDQASPDQASPDKTSGITAELFVERLEALRSPEELKKHHRYFKFDENESGDGDRFIGVRWGHVFALAKEFIQLPPAEIEKLLEST